MSQIVPHQNDFDLFAKLIVMDQSIRRIENDGTIYFVLVDVVGKMIDANRKMDASRFWYDFKRRSHRIGDVSERFRTISVLDKTGKRKQKMDGGDYETVLYIATSIPAEKANQLRAYVANRMAKLSEPTFKYLLRQQSEGNALAAEEIRYLYEIQYLPIYDDQDAFEDLGYQR